MNPEYDGLKVIRIPMGESDILTSSTTSNCTTVVLNLKVNEVCVSENEGDYFCSDYEHSRIEVDYTPGDAW